MPRMLTLLAGVLALSVLPMPAQAGWSVGVNFNIPAHRPYCYPRGYYYRPYPVYVRPAPVLVQPVPVYQPAYPVAPAPALAPVAAPAPAVSYSPSTREADIDRYLQRLQEPDERERAEAAVQLGRLRATGAILALTAGLNNDRSPIVRDASARALGLIGSPDALAALQRAAQADQDRDVRRSAAYAADIIRTSLSRP